MNRTQRAIKKACHKAFAHAKREKHLALHALKDSYRDHDKLTNELKSAVKSEKGLKEWHRKMVQDFAGRTVKEEKTA